MKCGAKVDPEPAPQAVELPEEVPLVPQQKPISWSRVVANVFCVLISSAVGMVSGAISVYFTAGVFLSVMLSSASDNPSESCARGMAIGMLSILSGAFLGAAGGSAYATKHLVIKH